MWCTYLLTYATRLLTWQQGSAGHIVPNSAIVSIAIQSVHGGVSVNTRDGVDVVLWAVRRSHVTAWQVSVWSTWRYSLLSVTSLCHVCIGPVRRSSFWLSQYNFTCFALNNLLFTSGTPTVCTALHAAYLS